MFILQLAGFNANNNTTHFGSEQATSAAEQRQNIFTRSWNFLYTPTILSLADVEPFLGEKTPRVPSVDQVKGTVRQLNFRKATDRSLIIMYLISLME